MFPSRLHRIFGIHVAHAKPSSYGFTARYVNIPAAPRPVASRSRSNCCLGSAPAESPATTVGALCIQADKLPIATLLQPRSTRDPDLGAKTMGITSVWPCLSTEVPEGKGREPRAPHAHRPRQVTSSQPSQTSETKSLPHTARHGKGPSTLPAKGTMCSSEG